MSNKREDFGAGWTTGISLSRSVTSPRASGCPSPWPLQATSSCSIMATPTGLTKLPLRGRYQRHSCCWMSIHLFAVSFSVCHPIASEGHLPLTVFRWAFQLCIGTPGISPGGCVGADSSTDRTFPGFQASFPLHPPPPAHASFVSWTLCPPVFPSGAKTPLSHDRLH